MLGEVGTGKGTELFLKKTRFGRGGGEILRTCSVQYDYIFMWSGLHMKPDMLHSHYTYFSAMDRCRRREGGVRVELSPLFLSFYILLGDYYDRDT